MSADSRPGVSRGYRFQAGLPAVLEDRGGGLDCTAHDLSRSGVLLVGELPPLATEQVSVRVRSRTGDLEGRFGGRVVRVERDPDGDVTRLAIEFSALDAPQKELLERLLARVMEGLSPAALESVRPGAPPHEIRKALEAVPLPHRIALAARAGPKEREILRHDPSPQVLEALARNPNLAPAEARALISNAQLLPSTLESLASDPRWTGDAEFRILIATHPRVPFPLAERIVAALPLSMLRPALARPALNPVLRDRIVKRLARG